MRLYIAGLVLLTFSSVAHSQAMTEAQRQAASEAFKYFDCGLKESLIYAIKLLNETPENIVIASAVKCKDDYTNARNALKSNFTAAELPGLMENVDEQFKKNVIANVLETRATIVRSKGN